MKNNAIPIRNPRPELFVEKDLTSTEGRNVHRNKFVGLKFVVTNVTNQSIFGRRKPTFTILSNKWKNSYSQLIDTIPDLFPQ